MHFGGDVLTDYSMSAMEFAHALEERGFGPCGRPYRISAVAQDAIPGRRRPANSITTQWTLRGGRGEPGYQEDHRHRRAAGGRRDQTAKLVANRPS